jgi:hypothetical protein
MSEKKRRMQEEFAEIRRGLRAEKTDWARLRSMAAPRVVELHERMKQKPALTEFETAEGEHWIMLALITQLGMAITQTNEQLANVEKAVKELKLTIK